MRIVWLTIFSAVLLWSAIRPHDYFTWFLEVAPALGYFAALVATRRVFPLTRLAAVLVLVHSIILMVGGHYTYAEVPLFDWIRDATGGDRNNYDKLGHFAQGFIPALLMREVVRRLGVVVGRLWQDFFVVCFALALSAFYELIEWWTALGTGEAAEAFLGTQGYVWDTQSDMLLAGIGAVVAVVALGRWHDRQLTPFNPRA